MSPASVGVEFRDFWPGFDPQDNFILSALAPLGGVSAAGEADVCVYSCFGTSHRLFAGCKVQVIGENVRPDPTSADFAIGFDRSTDDRFLRYPLWAWDVDTTPLLRPFGENGRPDPPEFCAFLANNPANPIRNALFEQLSGYRFVHAGGEVFHNADGPEPRGSADWRASKIDYLTSFRFTIAAENSPYPGYTTEKLVDAFLAGSVPIYWGDPLVDCDFDPRAFLDLATLGSVTRVVEAVRALDTDDVRFDQVRSVAPMTRQTWDRVGNPERLSEFLARVLAWQAGGDRVRGWRRRAARGRAQEAARRARIGRLRDLMVT